MKLWILRPRDNLEEDNPWNPWYDKAFGFVVRADTEEDARGLANIGGGDETGPVAHRVYRTGGDPWLDPLLSTCVELTDDGKPGVLISDFHSA